MIWGGFGQDPENYEDEYQPDQNFLPGFEFHGSAPKLFCLILPVYRNKKRVNIVHAFEGWAGKWLQQIVDSGCQVVGEKRLGDVVIGSSSEGNDPAVIIIQGCDDDNRCVRKLRYFA